MVAYHAAWFATEAGLVELPIRRDLRWIAFQKSIAGAFFGLVGVSLALSAPVQRGPFLTRLGTVLACAGVVTITSAVLDPSRIVTFGILHAIAACSVAAVPLLRLSSALLLPLGVTLVALGVGIRLDALSHPALHWTGLSPFTRSTFDHQPFLPWFGVVVVGLVLGRQLKAIPSNGPPVQGSLARFIRLLGRHSLLLYMAHVPFLIGIVALLKWLS